MPIRICYAVLLAAIALALTPKAYSADLGRYEEYDRRDRGAEIVLEGMRIIGGAIAARRAERNYYYYDAPYAPPAPTYYYDPYGTYYYGPRGTYAYGPNRYYGRPYYRHHRRHHHHHD